MFTSFHVHVEDMTTEEEINNLKLVFEVARDRHPEVKDCIIAGDMNADLHYVKDPEALQLYKDPKVSLSPAE